MSFGLSVGLFANRIGVKSGDIKSFKSMIYQTDKIAFTLVMLPTYAVIKGVVLVTENK